jgi:molybdate transport system permease protein
VNTRPRALFAPAVAGLILFTVPVVALLVRAPWSAVADNLGDPAVRTALRLSLVTSLAATAVAIVLGVPLAWVLARVDFPGRALARAITMLPMVLPPVVGGVALLLAFGRRGLLGGPLASLGIRLPFTTAGAVLAEAFVAIPFLVLTAEAGFRAVDPDLEQAGRALGAGPWKVFRRVTLPLARPSIVAGAVLCWARALGEFGATITFAGNYPGRTQTLPLAIYAALERGADGAIALSLVLLAVAIAVLVALRDRWLTIR